MSIGVAELLARRMQNVEEAVIENPSQPSFEGSEHYLGVSERNGGAIVAPSLKQQVASELAKEAAILKERRKAREAKNSKSSKWRERCFRHAWPGWASPVLAIP